MWDKRYSEPGYVYGKNPNIFLKTNVSKIPMGRVLCLAEGEGRNAVFLAEQGCDVTAVDSSGVGLEKAENLAAERGVRITTVKADLADFEFERNAWQGIVSIFCHLAPELRRKVCKKVKAGLTEGGVFILEGFTKKQLQYGTGGPKNEELLYSVGQLKEDLNGLRFEIAHEIERELDEGMHHRGMAAVVQLLGFKRQTGASE